MRVAMIEPVGGHSGMDYYDSGICEGVHLTDIEITLYTCDEVGILASTTFPVKPFFRKIYGTDPTWRRALRYMAGSLKSLSHAKRRKCDVVHVHFFHVGPLELFNVVLAKGLGMEVIITAHDVESLVEGLAVSRFERLAYRLASRVIVHNRVSASEVRTLLPVEPHMIAVIPHGNYLNTLDELPGALSARDSLDVDRASKVLLFFGQIKAAKGLDVLLEAMPAIVEAIPETLLVVAGRVWKDDFTRYAELINRLNISAHCRLAIGHVPHDEVATYFAAADLVVLPYLKIYQSGVLLMSMSYGKPVLASDLPGISENIKDGETGYLFAAEDSGALAEKAIQALSNENRRMQIGEAGQIMVRERHDWNAIGRQTAKLYRDVVSRK